jgi:glycosyltransferase involved in cell wall biosynthesis
MACGTPCIVHDIPVMHEVTAGAAVVLDYRDAHAVAHALQNLADQPAERDRLRQLGLARATEFSFERLARERIEAIRELVSE